MGELIQQRLGRRYVRGLLAEEFGHFDEVGRAQLQQDDAAVELLRDEANGGADDDELPAIAAGFVNIAQAPADGGGVAQRIVKVLQVEDGGAGEGGDGVERQAGIFGSGLGGRVAVEQAFGKGPGEDGERLGGGDLAKDAGDTLLFGGADVREGAAGCEDLGDGPGGTALCGRGLCGNAVLLKFSL